MPKPGSATERGYGVEHRAARREWAAELERLGSLPCARCGQVIYHVDAWDLGHTDDRTAYLGPEHQACNRADGGRRRHAPTAPRRRVL